jgi:pimeloyl-ACP methyl ester carboxylesterase
MLRIRSRLRLALIVLVATSLPLLAACSAVRFNHAAVRADLAQYSLIGHDIELSFGKLHYYAGGDGPPVLLIHGFAFGALETWVEQVPVFVRSHRVIAPDLFWFGESVPSASLSGSMDEAEQQARALSELLTRIGITKCSVVGVSFGGYVAMRLALAHPEQIEKLVLVDAAGLEPSSEERRQITANFGGKQHIADLLIPKDLAALDQLLRILFHKPRFIPKFVLREILREQFWQNRQAKLRMCNHMDDAGGFLAPEDLKTIALPTLLIWGRSDPLILPSMGARVAESIANSRIVYFEKSNHSPMLEEPRRFNSQVLQFLANQG